MPAPSCDRKTMTAPDRPISISREAAAAPDAPTAGRQPEDDGVDDTGRRRSTRPLVLESEQLLATNTALVIAAHIVFRLRLIGPAKCLMSQSVERT